MIEYWIDIPNLQTVDLPDSFEYIESKSITSIVMNMNEWIDVSTLLANLIQINENNDIDEAEDLDELLAELDAIQTDQTDHVDDDIEF